MTWLDVLPIVLVLVYGALGYFTGVVRRGISFVALYIGCLAATGMGLQSGGLLQQAVGLETPDARIYGFFGVLAIVLVGVELAAQLAHAQINVEAVALNKLTGVIVGVLTACLLSIIVVFELEAAGSPSGGANLSAGQAQVRDTVKASKFIVPLVNALERPVIAVFQPVLPNDPHQYFSRGPVT